MLLEGERGTNIVSVPEAERPASTHYFESLREERTGCLVPGLYLSPPLPSYTTVSPRKDDSASGKVWAYAGAREQPTNGRKDVQPHR
ncbi:hypothetical protein O3P69_001182 [Scylla paramamosain]|uniref:Uncharacterized protein n=1 Tax=Scylla paramamosain TaxID=85552 RepID=A0AAW0UP22_SCYPA